MSDTNPPPPEAASPEPGSNLNHPPMPSADVPSTTTTTTTTVPQIPPSPSTGTSTGTEPHHQAHHQAHQQQPQQQPAGRRNVNVRINAQPGQGRPQPRIHVDRATGQVRVDMGGGNVVRVPLHRQDMMSNNGNNRNNNNNGNANLGVRVVQMEPLVPQPLPETPLRTQPDDDDEAMNRFKCTLCCEYMKEPVSCGAKCASRFCHSCLFRVATEAAPHKPKCPTCRVQFTSIIKDEPLKREMYDGPTVPCRYNNIGEGCPEQLKLPLVTDHEKDCPYAKMKCRYATFGCPWTGTRGQLPAHETEDCHLARVRTLVDQIRHLKLDHSNRLDIVQQQAMGSMRMMNVHRQNLQRDQLKSTVNVFDLVQYCHVITCSTPHFLFTKDKWLSLFRSNEGRAAVINFLVLLPTMILCATTASLGLRDLLKLFDAQGQTHTPEFLLEDGLIGFCIGMLGIMLLAANFVDAKSSQHWGKFQIHSLLGKPPVMCDIVSVSSFTIHLAVMEYHGAGIKSFVLWLVLALSSTFFPALIATLSHAAARGMTTIPPPTAATMCSLARSFEPFLFGLRYSVLATFLGVMPCLDAAIVSVLLAKHLAQLSDNLVLKNSFLEGVPKSFIFAYFGAKAAMLTLQFRDWKDAGIPDAIWSILDSVFAIGILLLVTYLIHQAFTLGILLGNKIVTQAQADVRPEGTGIQKDYDLLGMMCFGGWVCMLGTLLQFR
jgi:hypothetical protein